MTLGPDYVILIIALIMLLAYTGDAMVGFGSSVIAVTLGALVCPIEPLIPVIVPTQIAVNGFIAVRHRSHIDRRLLLGRILPLMTLGGAIGLAIFPYINGPALKIIFGIMVALFTARELAVHLLSGKSGNAMGEIQACLWQLAAGVIHGVYATGGPALVYSLTGKTLPKSVFRATLCSVWTIMNILLTMAFWADGRVNVETLTLSACILPAAPLGILLGGRLHDRVSERDFRVVAFSILLAAACALIIRSI